MGAKQARGVQEGRIIPMRKGRHRAGAARRLARVALMGHARYNGIKGGEQGDSREVRGDCE